jgi:integrase/recombinase XerC
MLMMSLKSFTDYLLLEKNYSLHTITSYKKDLESFGAFILNEYQTASIDQVNYQQIRNWIVTLADGGVSNRTINRKISSLNSYYKFLQKIDAIGINPLAKHKALKTNKKIQIPFSEQEMSTVLDSLTLEADFEGLRNRLMVELFYATGIRRIELIQIKLGDIDLHNKTLKVLGKRNKERYIPLISSVIDSLNLYIIERNTLTSIKDKEYLFLTKKGVKIYETLVYRIINDYFSKVSSKVKRSPHILRHSFATHLLNQGANLNAVKELLGHSSLAATQIYTHNSISELKKVYSSTHPRSKK